jgi:hypothetical protein
MIIAFLKRLFRRKIQSTRLHQSCTSLPLNLFLDCLAEKKYSCLTICGCPTEKDCESAWKNIVYDFRSSSGHFFTILKIILEKEIAVLSDTKINKDQPEYLEITADIELLKRELHFINLYCWYGNLTSTYFEIWLDRLSTFYETEYEVNDITVMDFIDLAEGFLLTNESKAITW